MSDDSAARDFRRHLHSVADLIADYFEGVAARRVVPAIAPGEVAARLSLSPPEDPEPMERILADYREIIEPNVTHWNHPGFLAYFSSTSSEPGVLGEALAAALNSNAMLWRTSPAATELEERVCDWLRQMLGLPAGFHGHINDTASVGTFLALAAARHHRGDAEILERGMAARGDLPPLTVYASDQAHSSVDKAVVALGLGRKNLRRIRSDAEFEMDVGALRRAVGQDIEAGCRPIAIVATGGTTSTTSVDPMARTADVAREYRLWLHVDGAHAGSAALSARYRSLFSGWEEADSIVVNPHKWLSTPIDCSVLFVRRVEDLRAAFSVVPAYLRSDEGQINLMDLGIQLGRRFRALKLWMVIRAYGRSGLEARIHEHCRLALELAERIEAHDDFELAAPVPFNTVCFRWTAPAPEERDRLNELLLAQVNAAGPFFLSHTVLRGDYVLRIAIGNPRTKAEHVERAWLLVQETAARLS